MNLIPFFLGISLKVRAYLEFELVSHDVAVQHVSQYTTRTTPSFYVYMYTHTQTNMCKYLSDFYIWNEIVLCSVKLMKS